ncbi:hypothetical protein [Flavicella marina]|nr:hypothetical protein [Flavicella marina]
MKVFIFLSVIALFALTSNSNKEQETKVEVTKSLKILNIHDTKDAKILLA